MKIDGGCHCGRVTYEAEIDPDKAAICHCTHKKRAIATITIANTMAKIASPKWFDSSPNLSSQTHLQRLLFPVRA